MSLIKVKKGLDIRLEGEAARTVGQFKSTDLYAVRPTDFRNLTPKVIAKVGTKVKAGTPLFRDKYNEDVLFTSPVSGELVEIKRGERRKILEFIVKSDGANESEEFSREPIEALQVETIKTELLRSGLWTSIKRRPFAVIPKIDEEPLSIHISTFDSAPLSADYNFTLKDSMQEFQAGVDVLSKLTKGDVNVNIDASISNNIFENVSNAKVNKFSGKHPAGNVGIQIFHLAPINKGDIVWTLNPQDVVFIGRLFLYGKLDMRKCVAVAGSEIREPRYAEIIAGASIEPLVAENLASENVRCISGDVLTGTKIEKTGFLGLYDNLLTVIPEGDDYEMFGWAKPGLNRYSTSKTQLSWLKRNKKWRLNTNTHGGVRAFIVTGEMERVMPMDILVMQLLKAGLAEDVDALEKLGIYEVIEEDLALCEFVNTSKVEVQDILSRSIDLMIKETE